MRRLHWRLTLSYGLITVATLLCLELAAVIVASEITDASVPGLAGRALGQRASELVPYLSPSPPDRAGVVRWLAQHGDVLATAQPSRQPNLSFTVSAADETIAVAGRRGVVVAARGGGAPPAGSPLATHVPAGAGPLLQGTGSLVHLPGGSWFGARRVLGADGQQLGTLVIEVPEVDQAKLLLGSVVVTLASGIVTVPLAGIVGTVFGFFTAAGFTRRLRRLAEAAERWAAGDLGARAVDGSGDELGQTVGRLNRMAGELGSLVEARQQVAVLEERRRLAGDLHDSVKQRVFTIAMLTSSARDDPTLVDACLAEIDVLVRDVQAELTALVPELRPLGLEGRSLAGGLEDLAARSRQQAGLGVTLRADDAEACPGEVAEALYRVAQEALANVARHSGATSVRIELAAGDGRIRLGVADDGAGFDADRPSPGMGLASMRERMGAVGGTLEIVRATPRGTLVEARWSR